MNNRLHALLRQALQNISDGYHSTSYNLTSFNGPFDGGGCRTKFGERIFCYELYHQLRKLLDREQEVSPAFFPEYLLQGEVKKYQLYDLLELLKLFPLDGDYSPDLLFHQPATDGNALVIEVKCNPNIRRSEVVSDLNKLIQFLDRYRYQRGVFICTNNAIDNIVKYIQPDRLIFDEINTSRNSVASNIYIITKPIGILEYQETTLSKLLNL